MTPASPWQPLRQRLFLSIWAATLASNVGTWIHEVGAGWLMTSLAPRPLMVALVQAASSLPMFLLALPAGALADVVDRRRLLLVTQSWMMVSAAALGVLTLSGWITPWLLLAFTFAIGMGTALSAPAWQATVPELVPQDQLPAAVALNSMGFNVGRSVGPAIGGLLIGLVGSGYNFLFNAASFLAVLVVLLRWRRAPGDSPLPAERFAGAMKAGARYVRHSRVLHGVLLRGSLFVLFGSALWALLPLVARFTLQRGPTGYGVLLGCFGAGAVAGAVAIHRLRRRFGFDRLAIAATLVFAAALLTLGWSRSFPLTGVALTAAGGAWLTVLSGFNTAAQLAVPSWVRARALSFYLLVFFASMAGGSAVWGGLAGRFGMPAAFSTAAVGITFGLAATLRFPLRLRDAAMLSPSRHWPAPLLALDADADRGPVLVTVEYLIDPADAEAFAGAMGRLRRSRRRGGALRWGLWADATEPGRYVETFVDASWLEYLRHHERVTGLDREIEAEAQSFHRGDQPPRVSRYLGEPRAR